MASRLKHGEYVGGKESAEHYIWRTMLRRGHGRCGRYYTNVKVCNRWLDFNNFLADMGRRPSKDHQIDRIDVYGHYEPSNCRWTTRSVQQKNKRSTRRWTHNGQAGTLVDWANYVGISKELAFYRIENWGTFQRGKTWQRV